MTIIKSISAFEFCFYNWKIIIFIDREPLQHYRKKTSPGEFIIRWLQDLSLYDFEFKYIKGSTSILADYFSRNDFSANQEILHDNKYLINSENPLLISTDPHLYKVCRYNNSATKCIQNLPNNYFNIPHYCFLLKETSASHLKFSNNTVSSTSEIINQASQNNLNQQSSSNVNHPPKYPLIEMPIDSSIRTKSRSSFMLNYTPPKKYSSTWDSTCDISLFWVPIFIILCLL